MMKGLRRASTLLALLLAPAAVMAAAGEPDILTVTHGSRVELADHMVAGKLTLFDFYADWCGPCRQLDPQVRALAAANADRLAVRKVDVVDWNSEVARQFRIGSIPHLKLYGPDGQLIREGNAGAVLGALEARLGSPGGAAETGGTGSSPVPFLIGVLAIALVTALFLGKRSAARAPGDRRPAPLQAPRDASRTAAPADAVWFAVIQGSLEGPFTVDQLADLKRRHCVSDATQVRRRGDRDWRNLDRVL